MRTQWIPNPILAACTLATLGLSAGVILSVHGQEKSVAAVAAPTPSEEDNTQFFTQKVRPIFAQSCYTCHTTEMAGGLRLDSHEAVLKGGDSGPAIVPGEPEKSKLIEAVRQTGDLKMPPKGPKLTDSEIADLTEWVKRGGVWDSAEPTKPVVALLTAAQAKGSPGDDYFENKVRPIFAAQCNSCHVDREAGGLSLATREGLLKGGDTGPGIVVGDPDKSLLLIAVHQSGELKMPKKAPKMSEADIATLSDWVKMGAPWPKSTAPIRVAGKQITDDMRKWWSFVPLKDYPVPPIKDPAMKSWAKTDIDHFVLAKLEEKGLKPAPMADKRTLIRRATLDLTGLPPTPEEIADFEKDGSPDAFAKVVDRLLASPAYGERWGRHWLDVARYGDDDIRGLDPRGRGYMPFDGAWVYRDWVIKAINDDVTYDKFVKMQLAGDLMEKKPTAEDLKATGFLGGAPWIWDQAEPIQGRADERNERIDAVTRGMLGLTVACARCHDHKYDPILAKDYYALGGIFASSTYKEYNFVPDSEVTFWKEKFKKADDLDEATFKYMKETSQQVAQAYAAQTVDYMVAAWQVSGKPKKKVEDAADGAKLDPEMLDRWVKFLAKKPTYYPYLIDWQMMVAQGGTEDQAKALAESFQQRIIDLELENAKVEEENDKIKAKAGVPTEREKDVKPSDFDTYDQFCPGCTLELKVLSPEKANLYEDLFLRQLGTGIFEERGLPGLFVFRGWDLVRRLGPAQQAYFAQLQKEMGHGGRVMSVGEQYPFAHGTADKPKAVDIALDLRGNPHSHGDIVPRGFVTVLGPADKKPYTQGSGRLQLAEDIVASPIASRVWVNRVWKWHFGTGIVNSADNFGKVGDPPSDPELLDYLAVQFRKDGMSLKKLQRRIMLSAVYQQSSKETPEEHVKDPQNRFYSHFSVQRLDAEQLRDSMLFVAGDLDKKGAGGPATELGLDNDRRTVYAKVSRFRIDSFLQAFDFPNPTFTAEQRFSTNVPVQRLYFMNNAWVYAQAGKLAERVYDKGDDSARITEAYRLLFGRAPTPAELQAGLDFLKNTPEKPGYLVAQEPMTAWKQYSRVLFSSNEFEFLN
ncbi:PSD1 and planctomycete cytochrome C domain-containing protein [Granulicella aggregans]|uniref:PSD1 and planctomycete cytochrome C domain-containing protein n=1 Tax=Granulicella aggregans TaxID=474949 RepID=UPI0021DF750D|nr:PSD1 and planctomycete cytochrome C domain-containing protein [Granulicella aggregans]